MQISLASSFESRLLRTGALLAFAIGCCVVFAPNVSAQPLTAGRNMNTIGAFL